MTAISAGTTAFDSAHASASTFLHTFLSSQTTYDISAQNLHRAFDALDDDRNGMCDTVELMRAMITQDFDFTNFPRCYVRLLGLTQNKLLSDVELDKFTNDPSLMKTWTITFPIFVHVVRSLKQHVLLNPHVYRKTFKLARLNRLKELSANVRFLRRKGGDKNRNSKSVRTKEVTVSPDDVTVSSRAPVNSLDDDAVPPAHFNIQNAPSSLRLVFSDINSANDEVETSTHAEIVAALHDLGVNVTVYDFRIDHLVKQGNVNATLQTLHPFLRAETRPENSKVRERIERVEARSRTHGPERKHAIAIHSRTTPFEPVLLSRSSYAKDDAPANAVPEHCPYHESPASLRSYSHSPQAHFAHRAPPPPVS